MRQIGELRRASGRGGAAAEVAWATKLYLSDTDGDARQRTARSLQRAEEVANEIAGFGRRAPEQAYERNLIGSPATITRRLQQYAAAGVGLVVMNCLAPDIESFVRMLGRFVEDVAQAFR